MSQSMVDILIKDYAKKKIQHVYDLAGQKREKNSKDQRFSAYISIPFIIIKAK